MKIKNIKEVNPRTVYAITTSSGTFIANGLAHHNCVGCNMFGNGKILDFEDHLVKEIGRKEVDKLKQSRFKIFKVDVSWYKERIEHYEKEVEGIIS